MFLELLEGSLDFKALELSCYFCEVLKYMAADFLKSHLLPSPPSIWTSFSLFLLSPCCSIQILSLVVFP